MATRLSFWYLFRWQFAISPMTIAVSYYLYAQDNHQDLSKAAIILLWAISIVLCIPYILLPSFVSPPT